MWPAPGTQRKWPVDAPSEKPTAPPPRLGVRRKLRGGHTVRVRAEVAAAVAVPLGLSPGEGVHLNARLGGILGAHRLLAISVEEAPVQVVRVQPQSALGARVGRELRLFPIKKK